MAETEIQQENKPVKRAYGNMLLFFVNNKLSVLFEGEQIRSFYVPPAVRAKVSCVLRRSDALLANSMVDFIIKLSKV